MISALGSSIHQPPDKAHRIDVVERLCSRHSEIEEAIVAHIHNVAPDSADDGDLQYEEGQRAAVVAILDYALTGIEHGEEETRPSPSEAERGRHSPERRRTEDVRRLLAGGLVDGAELDYELDAWHLGVIGTGVVGQAFRGMAAGLGCQLLSVSHDEQSVWAWIGGQREAVVGGVERLVSVRWPAGVSLALGELTKGLEGWRLTHRQAQDASLFSLHQPQTLTRYADVALLAPWLRDETRARWLVERYLSPLDNHRCPGVTLRQTLREYFATGHNASTAARALYVSRRTMRNRMVLIEESLGSLLHERQAELELALRLDELLADSSRRL